MRLPLRPAVAYCFCRLYAKEQGHQCELNAPLTTCMTFSLPASVDQAVNSSENPEMMKQRENVYKLLKKCDEIGLVHQVIFIPSPNYSYVVCNCCPDCCEVLKNFREATSIRTYHQNEIHKIKDLIQGLNPITSQKTNYTIPQLKKMQKYHEKAAKIPISPLEVRSVFVSETIDPKSCINCGKCSKRCYFDSRVMVHQKLHYMPDQCYGCGLCISTCPKDNIRLIKRKKSILMAKPGEGITHFHPHTHHHNENHSHAT
jgi:MinD superfamily P-loop ATPase